MPIHDWTRVPAGLFHDFHQRWTIAICDLLNAGVLPQGYYALIEQKVDGPEPDVLAVETGVGGNDRSLTGGTITADPPRTQLARTIETDSEYYTRKANRIAVRHYLGEVTAVIEIVSPGNKDGNKAFHKFVEKAADFLRDGVHLLIVDLFPPTRRDPNGVPQAIADEFFNDPDPLEVKGEKPLVLVSYSAGTPLKVFIEMVAVGDELPSMPLFITPKEHILVPLQTAYEQTWSKTTQPVKKLMLSK